MAFTKTTSFGGTGISLLEHGFIQLDMTVESFGEVWAVSVVSRMISTAVAAIGWGEALLRMGFLAAPALTASSLGPTHARHMPILLAIEAAKRAAD